MMAPALRSRVTTVASRNGTNERRPVVPAVEMMPAVSNESFTVIGTPCNGPTWPRCLSARSAKIADARAESAFSCTKALSAGLSASIRRRYASTTSTQDTSLRRMAAARRVADIEVMSCGGTFGLAAKRPCTGRFAATPPAAALRMARRESVGLVGFSPFRYIRRIRCGKVRRPNVWHHWRPHTRFIKCIVAGAGACHCWAAAADSSTRRSKTI